MATEQALPPPLLPKGWSSDASVGRCHACNELTTFLNPTGMHHCPPGRCNSPPLPGDEPPRLVEFDPDSDWGPPATEYGPSIEEPPAEELAAIEAEERVPDEIVVPELPSDLRQRPSSVTPPKPARSRRRTGKKAASDQRTTTLADCIDTFRQYMHLPDPGPVYIALATVVANRRDGDPLWVLLVGGPSTGKTEPVRSLQGEDDCHLVGHVTEAGLLSATPKKQTSSNATGGLLRETGTFGILLIKDFTSIISMPRDPRASLLAALREIYDGTWTRTVGTDGGKSLSWQGKLGVLGCVTGAIDTAHGVMSTMGERFILYRMPDMSAAEQAEAALRRSSDSVTMRATIAAAFAEVLAKANSHEWDLRTEDEAMLISLSQLVARARSAVERDSYNREITLVPDPEAPARLVLGLRQLLHGLEAIGVEHTQARALMVKAGLDSMPVIRRQILELLAGGPERTSTVADRLGYPTSTTRRSLEDLAAHGLIQRDKRTGNEGDLWLMSPATIRLWSACFPEMSEGVYPSLHKLQNIEDDISGTETTDKEELPF